MSPTKKLPSNTFRKIIKIRIARTKAKRKLNIEIQLLASKAAQRARKEKDIHAQYYEPCLEFDSLDSVLDILLDLKENQKDPVYAQDSVLDSIDFEHYPGDYY